MVRSAVYIFIDASNLWQAQKAKGRFFDYQKLTNFIQKTHNASAIKVFYYTAYPAEGTRSYTLDGKHKFLTFLGKVLASSYGRRSLSGSPLPLKPERRLRKKGIWMLK